MTTSETHKTEPAVRTIVVGVDDSDESMAAARWAGAAADHSGAILTLVHAWHWPYQAAPIGIHAEVISLAQDAAGALLKRVVAQVSAEYPDVEVVPRLVVGSAFGALTDRSDKADLVVVGRYGRNAISRFFLGSTSAAVANHAHCPVAVIPVDAGPLPVDPSVMVAMDGSTRSVDAAAWAVNSLPGAHRFVMIHSHDEWLLDNLATPDDFREQRQADAEKLVREAVEFVEKMAGRPGVAFEQIVIPGDPRETVMRNSEDTDVLVVGARGHTGLTGVLLGSFATFALHHAKVPLIIVKDDADHTDHTEVDS